MYTDHYTLSTQIRLPDSGRVWVQRGRRSSILGHLGRPFVASFDFRPAMLGGRKAMVPTIAQVQRMFGLLAADTVTLNASDKPKVRLVKAAFAPAPSLDYASLTFADFNGSDPQQTGTAPFETLNPQNGNVRLQLVPPGMAFETQNLDNLPQVIFGYAVTDSDGTTLYWSANLTPPVTLTAANQNVNIPPFAIEVPPAAFR